MLHVVLATVSDRLYAFPSSQVVEVIPRVQAQSLPGTARWVLGQINYRGQLMLAVDFARLLDNTACPPKMANRILVVRSRQATETPGEWTGVLVDSVRGSEPVDFRTASAHSRLAAPSAGFLTLVALAGSEMIQLVDTLKLPNPFEDPEGEPC